MISLVLVAALALGISPAAQDAQALLEILRDWKRDGTLPGPEDVPAILAETEALSPDAEIGQELAALAHRLGLARRPEDGRRFVLCAGQIAEAAGDLGTAGWALDWLGQEAWIEGRLEEGVEFFVRAAEVEQQRGSTAGHVQEIANAARIRMTQGRLEEALELVRSAESRARESGSKPALRRAAEVRGSLLYDLGRHREALALCLESSPAQQDVPEDEVQVRLDLLATNVLAEVGRLETAATFARRAHAGAASEALQRTAPLLVLETGLTLGLLLGDLGEIEEGLARIDEANEGFARLGDERGQSWALKNRAFLLFAEERFDEARAAFVAVERAGRRLEVPWLEGIGALGLAETLAFGSRALTSEEAVEIERALTRVDERAEELFEREFEWRAAIVRGRVNVLSGRDGQALRHFEQAVAGIERWRRRLEVPGLTEHALRQRSDPYREAALCAARTGDADTALHFARLLHERATERLGTRRGSDLGPAPTPAIESTRQRIGRLEFSIRRKGEDTDALRLELAVAEAELESLLLAHDLAPGRRSQESAGMATAFDGTAWLDAHDAGIGIVFVVGSECTLAIGLERDARARMHLLDIGRERLESLVARLRDPMRELEAGRVDLSNLGFDVAAARELHDRLIAPLGLPDGAPLVVVPDSALAAIPFEMWVTGGAAEAVDPTRPFAHLAGLRFLGDDHAITVTGTLDLPLRSRPPGPEGTLVLIAPPEAGLRRAAIEAEAISAQRGTAPVRVIERATRSDLVEGVPQVRNVHFVAHGRVDDGAPAQGHLILAGPDPTTLDRLEAWQIEALSLDLDRVVLSACHTAEGAWYAGAGLAGLARGFLRAGTREVVASQWAVEDGATARYMALFYEALQQGQSTADALRTARCALRASSDSRGFSLAHPYFWAAFVLRR